MASIFKSIGPGARLRVLGGHYVERVADDSVVSCYTCLQEIRRRPEHDDAGWKIAVQRFLNAHPPI